MTYTIAYAGDALIAVVPDGEDLEQAIAAVEEHTGEDFNTYCKVEGCILTNDPQEDDLIVFSSPKGCCGFLMVREADGDVSYDYAVHR